MMNTSPPPPRPEALIEDLVSATRIMINEGVLDVFGHVAFRDPARADVFWMGLAGAPARIAAGDVQPFDMETGAPLIATDAELFSERCMYAALFRARPDLQAACHHHSDALMPYCLGARVLGAISPTGGWMGAQVPLWDSRDQFGDTSLLVTEMAQAEDLAAAMGEGTIVLMRGHGTMVAGFDLRDMTYRTVHACREARCDTAARGLGDVTVLSPGEITRCRQIGPPAIARAWSHWTALLPSAADTDILERDTPR